MTSHDTHVFIKRQVGSVLEVFLKEVLLCMYAVPMFLLKPQAVSMSIRMEQPCMMPLLPLHDAPACLICGLSLAAGEV